MGGSIMASLLKQRQAGAGERACGAHPQDCAPSQTGRNVGAGKPARWDAHRTLKTLRGAERGEDLNSQLTGAG